MLVKSQDYFSKKISEETMEKYVERKLSSIDYDTQDQSATNEAELSKVKQAFARLLKSLAEKNILHSYDIKEIMGEFGTVELIEEK